MPGLSDEEFEALGQQGAAPAAPAAPKPRSMTDAEFEAVGNPFGPPKTGPIAASVAAQKRRNAMTAEREQLRIQSIQGALGSAYDPAETFGGDVSDFLLEMDMGRSATPSAMSMKFKQRYPLGDIIRVPYGDSGEIALLARRNKDEPFREVGNIGRFTGAMFSEPTLLGGAGTLVTSPIMGPAATGLLTGAGYLLQREVEALRGYEEDPLEAGYGQAIREGLIAGTVDMGTRGLLKLLGLGSKYGPAATEVQKAARRQGLEQPGRGQVGGPFMKGMFLQVGRTAGRVGEKIESEQRSLLEAFQRTVDSVSPSAVSDNQLHKIIFAQKMELDRLMAPRTLTREQTGEALQKGLETWQKASRMATGRAYDEALALGDDAVFDLRAVQDVAREGKRGTVGEGQAVEATAPAPEGYGPNVVTGEEKLGVRVSGGLPGELQGVIGDILALNPTVTKFADETGEWGGFEIMKALRTRLFDLKQSEDGQTRLWAGRLWSSMTDAMETPLSASPQFLAAHRAASALHKATEETLEKGFIAQALRSDTPETLAKKYFMPGNSTALAAIKELVPADTWKTIQTGFGADLMHEETAQAGLNRINRFLSEDQEGLKLLLHPSEVTDLRKYLVMRQRFESSAAHRILKKNLTEGERMVALVKEGSGADVRDLVKLAGGPNSQLAAGMRAGVYKDILDSASMIAKSGREVIHPEKMLTAVEKWQTSGRLKGLFKEEDWQRIRDFAKYGGMLNETSDVGGGMMAGQLRQEAIEGVAGIMSPTGAKKMLTKVIQPIFSNEAVAMFLSWPRIMGWWPRGKPRLNKMLRQGTIMYSTMMEQIKHQQRVLGQPVEE